MLNSMQSKQPLLLADDLCEYSRNLLHQTDPTDAKTGDDVPEGPGGLLSLDQKNPQGGSSSNQDKSGKTGQSAKSKERQRKAALK